MKNLKVGLSGFGAGGQIYNAPIISSVAGLEITRILTSSEANIRAAQQGFPQAKVVHELKELLQAPEVDLVVITTPNHLHYPYAKEALMAGKHVVVEKPFTPTVKEAEELIALAEKQKRILTVNHNRRWDSDIRTIKKVLQKGSLGKVVEFEAHFDRFRNYIKEGWKEHSEIEGSGILYDLGSHLIDQALWLFGKPREIFANLLVQREASEVIDSFELLLFYPELKVTLKAGMLVKVPGPRYTVLGRQGSFIKYGMDVQEEDLKQGKTPETHPEWGREPESIWGTQYVEEDQVKIESETGDYRRFYKNVYDAITGQAPLEVTAAQARDVIAIIELAIKSHEEKRVVEL